MTLAYDPLGRLFAVASPGTYTRFLYDGDALVAEYDGTGAMTRRYVHNAGADVPLLSYQGSGVSQPSYLHADHQGSIVAVSDSAAASAINTYDEYGIPGTGNTGRFQYTGQIWLAELGMYYYKARIYSPTLGRFLQTDPIGYGAGMNLYAYVGNNPVNFTDPLGLQDDPNECGGSPCPVVTGDKGFQSAAWIRSGGGSGLYLFEGGNGGNPGPRQPSPAPRPSGRCRADSDGGITICSPFGMPRERAPERRSPDSEICKLANDLRLQGELAVGVGSLALATPLPEAGVAIAGGGGVAIGLGALLGALAGC